MRQDPTSADRWPEARTSRDWLDADLAERIAELDAIAWNLPRRIEPSELVSDGADTDRRLPADRAGQNSSERATERSRDVDSDRVKGKAKKTEGELQEKWGEAKDKAKETWEDAKDKIDDTTDEAEKARSRA